MSEKMSVPPSGPPSGLKSAAKAAARFAALVGVSPVLLSFHLNAALRGRDKALESRSQLLSLWPGLTGEYLRRAFLQQVLARCHPSALVEFGTIFSQCAAMIDENVYVGPHCGLGWVHLEKDVLLASNVQIPSGGTTHFFSDPNIPIREQGGERKMVTIGEGAWVGTGAIVMADVGKGSIIAAGAVVTKPVPEFVIAGGVPAKVLRPRFETTDHG
jgi:virginiamycin A acetyltransferase